MACLLTVTWASLVSGYTGGPGLSWDEESFLALGHIPEIITRQLLECGDPLSTATSAAKCNPLIRATQQLRFHANCRAD